MSKKKPSPEKKAVSGKIPGILDDFPSHFEFVLNDVAFNKAMNRASKDNHQAKSLFDTHIEHQYRDKLDEVKAKLVRRILFLAKNNMTGIQYETFMLTFKFGVNKCRMGRMYDASRQSIQIRMRRAIKILRSRIFQDKACIVFLAEWNRLEKKLIELDA